MISDEILIRFLVLLENFCCFFLEYENNMVLLLSFDDKKSSDQHSVCFCVFFSPDAVAREQESVC